MLSCGMASLMLMLMSGSSARSDPSGAEAGSKGARWWLASCARGCMHEVGMRSSVTLDSNQFMANTTICQVQNAVLRVLALRSHPTRRTYRTCSRRCIKWCGSSHSKSIDSACPFLLRDARRNEKTRARRLPPTRARRAHSQAISYAKVTKANTKQACFRGCCSSPPSWALVRPRR